MIFFATMVANVARSILILNRSSYRCLVLLEFNKATMIARHRSPYLLPRLCFASKEKKAAILLHKGKHPKFSEFENLQLVNFSTFFAVHNATDV